MGGAASHPVLINAFQRDKRPKDLAEGEAGLYDQQGGADFTGANSYVSMGAVGPERVKAK